MYKNKKLIIFDMDGTLIDSMQIWNIVDKVLIKKISNQDIDENEILIQRNNELKRLSNSSNMYLEYCNYLREKYNSSYSKEEIMQMRYKISEEYLTNVIDYKPNADKVLHKLKEKGFKLAIATTGREHAMEQYRKYNKNMINKANIDELFDTIHTQDTVKNMKPNPEVHLKILEELKISSEESLVIEDSLVGVEAANNANIEVAVIYDKSADKDREEINKLSKYQFKDFAEMLEVIERS
jgi:HAD superfamily hydrolase (TIGR01509 family)